LLHGNSPPGRGRGLTGFGGGGAGGGPMPGGGFLGPPPPEPPPPEGEGPSGSGFLSPLGPNTNGSFASTTYVSITSFEWTRKDLPSGRGRALTSLIAGGAGGGLSPGLALPPETKGSKEGAWRMVVMLTLFEVDSYDI